MSVRRLFLGLLLPPELQEAVALAARGALDARSGAVPGLRLPRTDGLHLTLVFLGFLETARRAALEAELDQRLAGAGAPRLRLRGAGAFPSPRRPRVLWVGVEEEPERAGCLVHLQRHALDAAEAAGIDVGAERERPWRPHLTVARVDPRAERTVRGALLDLDRNLDPDLAWTPDRVDLLESVSQAEGPPRTLSLAGWPLADATPEP